MTSILKNIKEVVGGVGLYASSSRVFVPCGGLKKVVVVSGSPAGNVDYRGELAGLSTAALSVVSNGTTIFIAGKDTIFSATDANTPVLSATTSVPGCTGEWIVATGTHLIVPGRVGLIIVTISSMTVTRQIGNDFRFISGAYDAVIDRFYGVDRERGKVIAFSLPTTGVPGNLEYTRITGIGNAVRCRIDSFVVPKVLRIACRNKIVHCSLASLSSPAVTSREDLPYKLNDLCIADADVYWVASDKYVTEQRYAFDAETVACEWSSQYGLVVLFKSSKVGFDSTVYNAGSQTRLSTYAIINGNAMLATGQDVVVARLDPTDPAMVTPPFLTATLISDGGPILADRKTGRIWAGGNGGGTYGGTAVGGLWIMTETGALSSLTPTTTSWLNGEGAATAADSILALAQWGRKILIAGTFSITTQSVTYYDFIVVDADTGVTETGWPMGTSSGSLGFVENIKVYGDYLYLITSTVNQNWAGGTRTGISRIHLPTKTLDTWTLSSVNARVQDLVVDGSLVYMVGNFGTINGTSRNKAATVSLASPSSTQAWNPNLSAATVTRLARLGNGYYAIGANSSSFTVNGGAATRKTICAVDDSTGTVAAWHPMSDITASTRVSFLSVVGGYLRYMVDANATTPPVGALNITDMTLVGAAARYPWCATGFGVGAQSGAQGSLALAPF